MSVFWVIASISARSSHLFCCAVAQGRDSHLCREMSDCTSCVIGKYVWEGYNDRYIMVYICIALYIRIIFIVLINFRYFIMILLLYIFARKFRGQVLVAGIGWKIRRTPVYLMNGFCHIIISWKWHSPIPCQQISLVYTY